MLYTKEDADNALDGHMPIPKSDIEIVAYRTGNALSLAVNKRGTTCFRATLANAFDDFEPTPDPSIDPTKETFIIRSLKDAQEELQTFLKSKTT